MYWGAIHWIHVGQRVSRSHSQWRHTDLQRDCMMHTHPQGWWQRWAAVWSQIKFCHLNHFSPRLSTIDHDDSLTHRENHIISFWNFSSLTTNYGDIHPPGGRRLRHNSISYWTNVLIQIACESFFWCCDHRNCSMRPRSIQRFIPIFQSAHKHWDHSILPRRSIHAVYYDLVLPDEIETVWKLEKQGAVNSVSVLTTLDFLGYEGFPSDEADSLETLRYVFRSSFGEIFSFDSRQKSSNSGTRSFSRGLHPVGLRKARSPFDWIHVRHTFPHTPLYSGIPHNSCAWYYHNLCSHALRRQWFPWSLDRVKLTCWVCFDVSQERKVWSNGIYGKGEPCP